MYQITCLSGKLALLLPFLPLVLEKTSTRDRNQRGAVANAAIAL